MTRVGERPLHRDVIPSCRAIFCNPSRVELNVLRRASSTAQSAVDASEELNMAEGLVAMQKDEALFTQKTSRQQAVTPRFGGRFEKEKGGDADVRIGIGVELG